MFLFCVYFFSFPVLHVFATCIRDAAADIHTAQARHQRPQPQSHALRYRIYILSYLKLNRWFTSVILKRSLACWLAHWLAILAHHIDSSIYVNVLSFIKFLIQIDIWFNGIRCTYSSQRYLNYFASSCLSCWLMVFHLISFYFVLCTSGTVSARINRVTTQTKASIPDVRDLFAVP